METVTIYGIKNCDSMKKAFAWFDSRKITYVFHDYKKAAPDSAVLARAIKQLGWDNVINCKGTTWRALPESMREAMDASGALAVALAHPSVIKRPLIAHGDKIVLGFNADDYEARFGLCR